MDRLNWLLSPDLGREKLALLTCCTLAMYVLAANLAWRWHGNKGRRNSRLGQWLIQLLQLLYYVGIPLASLWCATGWRSVEWPHGWIEQMGILTTWSGHGGNVFWRLLGVSQAGDLACLGTALAMWIGGLGLLWAGWTWYVRANDRIGEIVVSSWWKALHGALCMQMLLAFYRGVALAWGLDRSYAAFLGLALMVAGWLLNPWRRSHVVQTLGGYQVARDWTLALFTTVAAMTVHSLWLLVLMHGLWLVASDWGLRLLADRYRPPIAAENAG